MFRSLLKAAVVLAVIALVWKLYVSGDDLEDLEDLDADIDVDA